MRARKRGDVRSGPTYTTHMARANARLVAALRQTATRLSNAAVEYRWSSFAHCNCGHLAQTLTGLEPAELQRRALQRPGDWAAQASEFPRPDYGDRPALDEGVWTPDNVGACGVTGLPLDTVLEAMVLAGLELLDIAYLERLADPEVRRRLGQSTRQFAHYRRENVIAYFAAWADLLEERLFETERDANEIPVAAE